MKCEWDEIKKKLLQDKSNKSVLLGNGFTIACANNNKLSSKKIIDNVHKYFKNRTTTKNITNVEDYIYEVEKQFIKQIYNLLPIEKIEKIQNLDNIIEFLKIFDNFYTLNYDHVLYQLLMILRDRGKHTNDGFGKQDNQLIWSNDKPQSVYYLHGAFHFIVKNDNQVKKVERSIGTNLFTKIKKEWEKGEKSHIIIASDHRTKELKMSSEKYSQYLNKCFNSFKQAQGILVTMGVSFSNSDTHILEAIKDNKNLENVYIGYYEKKELKRLENLFETCENIHYYSTKNLFDC